MRSGGGAFDIGMILAKEGIYDRTTERQLVARLRDARARFPARRPAPDDGGHARERPHAARGRSLDAPHGDRERARPAQAGTRRAQERGRDGRGRRGPHARGPHAARRSRRHRAPRRQQPEGAGGRGPEPLPHPRRRPLKGHQRAARGGRGGTLHQRAAAHGDV